jgi:hypothetical protein
MDDCAHRLTKNGTATIDEYEMKPQILQAANILMEYSRMYKPELLCHWSKASDFGMRKLKRAWTMDEGALANDVHWYKCPMFLRFGCCVQIKVIENASYIALLQRGEHDKTSHAHDKDKSKHLKVRQLKAIRTGVLISPAQGARILPRNLTNLSLEMRVDPNYARSTWREEKTYLEQLDDLQIDDSVGSLVRFSEEILVADLLHKLNDLESNFISACLSPL